MRADATLTEAEIAAALDTLSNWQRQGGAITRLVRTRTFARALLLANAVGYLAEAANHHPDLTIRYGSLAIRLTTHDAGGLTAKDFALARQIEQLVG